MSRTRRFPSWHPPHRYRHGAVPGRPRQLYRRPRLRDLDGAGIPAHVLDDADCGRRGIRHRPVRLARAQRAAGWRRTTAHGRASTGRSTARSKPGSTVSWPIPRRPISSARRARSPSASEGGKLRLRAFIVEAEDADVIGDEPIWFGGAVRGWVTSGGYAHNAKASVAMGYVPKEIADEAKVSRSSCWASARRAHPAGAAVRCQFRADARVSELASMKIAPCYRFRKSSPALYRLAGRASTGPAVDRRWLRWRHGNVQRLQKLRATMPFHVYHFAYIVDVPSSLPHHPKLPDGRRHLVTRMIR